LLNSGGYLSWTKVRADRLVPYQSTWHLARIPVELARHKSVNRTFEAWPEDA
jgi:hypothetical protein